MMEKRSGEGFGKQVAMAGNGGGIVLNGNSPLFVTRYRRFWPGDKTRTGGGLSLKGGFAEFPLLFRGIATGRGTVSKNQEFPTL